MINLGQIGVHLALSGNVASVIGGWIKQFYALNAAAKYTQTQLSAIKIAAGGIVLGGAIIAEMEHLTHLGDKYLASLHEMKKAGYDAATISGVQKLADQIAQSVPETSVTQNIHDWVDLKNALGSESEATKFLELAEKATVMMAAGMKAVGVNADGAADQVREMAKALELAGAAKDPERFAKDIDLMLKAAEAARYQKVTGADFHSMVVSARSSALGFSDDYLTKYLPTLMQEMSATRLGTMANQFYQQVIGTTATAKALQYANTLGLVDPSRLRRGRHGEIVGEHARAWRGADLAESNPYEWVQKILLPALKAHGINAEKDIRAAIAELFPQINRQEYVNLKDRQPDIFSASERIVHRLCGPPNRLSPFEPKRVKVTFRRRPFWYFHHIQQVHTLRAQRLSLIDAILCE